MEELQEIKENTEKKSKRFEVLVAVFLGITSVLVAWSVWIGSLHGGNQSANYTTSNNYSSEGSAEYNTGSQLLVRDMMTWNVIQDYMFEKAIADFNNREDESKLIQDKVDNLIATCPESMQEAIAWAYEQDPAGTVSPFLKEGMIDSYFTRAKELHNTSQDYLEEGKNDSRNCDKYNLVTVIYSLVLFLLGIVGVLKHKPARRIVFWLAVGLLAFATIFMFTIPLPTDFDLFGYFRS